MAPPARTNWLTLAPVAIASVALACLSAGDRVTVRWTMDPTTPVANAPVLVRVTIFDDGRPAAGAALRLEAHMSHPGMTPVVGALMERGDGVYEARLHLSMAGDWTFVVSGELADGARITEELAVPGVRPSG